MIDNKGKIFGKINVIDFLVILVLVVAVCATVFKFAFSRYDGINKLIPTPPVRVEYVLKYAGIRDFTVDNMIKGERLYDADTDQPIGIIKDVEVKNALEYIAKADGSVVTTEVENRYDAYVTVECNTNIRRNTHYVALEDNKNGSELCVNMYLMTYSARFNSMGQIVSITQK